jgi:hypothetical protein
MHPVPLDPGSRMLLGRHVIRFRVITLFVGQDEIVSEIGGISRPGDEVVNLRLHRQLPLTVHARAMLHLHQDRTAYVQIGSLLAEKECPEIGDVAELMGVELLDEPHPRTLE